MQNILGPYVAIGMIIFVVQQQCPIFSGERWVVRHQGTFLALTMWLPDLVKHVWSENMTLREYLAPTRCTSKQKLL